MFKFFKGVSINTRMENILKFYNDRKFEDYKPYILSFKSREILEYFNQPLICISNKINDLREYNDMLLNVAKKCYDRFNPLFMYAFNDEIHFVYFNVSDYNDLYNGNVNKTLTSMSSFIARLFTKEFMNKGLDFDFTIKGKYAEFKDDYEALNYIIWRQLDCKRNNAITLMKYFDNNFNKQKLEDIIQNLFHQLNDNGINYDDIEFIINGNVLQKRLIYEDKTRKKMDISHELLNINFSENLDKYFVN